MAVHVFTSFSYSYLNRARVLAETVRRTHPDWVIWAVITDKEPKGFVFNLQNENFDHLLLAADLFGTETDRWLFGMDVVEACTAVKGRALKHIMKDPTADKIIYFDPDIAVFSNLKPIIELLDEYSIMLTPHQVDPEPRSSQQSIIDNEMASLQYGAFNLGFLAVRNDAEAMRFANWWDDRLVDWCHDRLDIGVFVDQKWCNLVPCFFDGVKILRDPGCNVASWNINLRKFVSDEDGNILVNGSPLKFFHFTKLGPIGDAMTRRYARDNITIYEIWWWYSQRVQALTDDRIPSKYWSYGTFRSGEPIEKKLRERYRSDPMLQQDFPNPFESKLQRWWKSESRN